MRRTYHDVDDLPYYELVCDDCGTRYACHTDACYDWRILADEATFVGWDVRDRSATGTHRCRACARSPVGA